MFTILDYSSALEYSIIRRYTNIVYYYYIPRYLSGLDSGALLFFGIEIMNDFNNSVRVYPCDIIILNNRDNNNYI